MILLLSYTEIILYYDSWSTVLCCYILINSRLHLEVLRCVGKLELSRGISEHDRKLCAGINNKRSNKGSNDLQRNFYYDVRSGMRASIYFIIAKSRSALDIDLT